MRAWLALSLLFGCTSAPAPMPRHPYSRILVRVCVGDEYEHVISQVERFLDDCAADGQDDCERRACDKLREEWIRRNSPQHAYARPPSLPPLKPRRPPVRTA